MPKNSKIHDELRVCLVKKLTSCQPSELGYHGHGDQHLRYQKKPPGNDAFTWAVLEIFASLENELGSLDCVSLPVLLLSKKPSGTPFTCMWLELAMFPDVLRSLGAGASSSSA